MKIEELGATPPEVSPQMRYAALHRSIESGLATDRTWVELLGVCLELGRREEAIDAFRHLDDAVLRRRMLTRMHRAQLLLQTEVAPDGSFRQRLHSDAPAGRGSPRPQAPRETELPRSSLGELVGDAFRFLFLDHMPLTVIVATVTFPLVIGLGGFLTSTAGPSAYFAMSLLALIPAASALALVGALARRILLDANSGLIDPPAVPTFGRLLAESLRFGADALLLSALYLGPAIALAQFGPQQLGATLAAACFGGALLPMAVAMRSTREDWSALRPAELLQEIRRVGSRYLGVVAVIALLLAPAIAGLLLTQGSQTYMSISVVGPLTVAPLFIAARMLGQVLCESRRAERHLATVQARSTAARRQAAPGANTRPQPASSRPQPTRRAISRAQPHPEARPQPQARPQARPQPTGRSTTTGTRPPQPGSEHQPPMRRHATVQASSTGRLDNQPDLTGLPGASIFRGAERVSAGAAARNRDRS